MQSNYPDDYGLPERRHDEEQEQRQDRAHEIATSIYIDAITTPVEKDNTYLTELCELVINDDEFNGAWSALATAVENNNSAAVLTAATYWVKKHRAAFIEAESLEHLTR